MVRRTRPAPRSLFREPSNNFEEHEHRHDKEDEEEHEGMPAEGDEVEGPRRLRPGTNHTQKDSATEGAGDATPASAFASLCTRESPLAHDLFIVLGLARKFSDLESVSWSVIRRDG